MTSRRLAGVIELLTSDKIKDRSEGILELRELLSSRKNRNAITESNSWLAVLQAVFHVVVIERNIHAKKPTTAVLGRLTTAVQTVRWIVDRAATDFPRKTIKSLLAHLMQTIILKKQLYSPVATDYIKALKSVLEHRPHLEHLDQGEWTDATTLSFSVIFGDEITLTRELLFDEDRMEADELEGPPGPIGVNKTNRAGQQEADLLACIERLFSSTSAPLVAHSSDLIERFIRFFRLFPSETTAHQYAVKALNLLLSEIEFNNLSALIRAAPALWPSLVSLWPTKQIELREAIGIALRILFPCVLRTAQPEPLLRQLMQRFEEDLSLRWRVEDLRLEALSLTPTASPSHQPFHAATFSMGSGFSTSQALSWATLELAADCLAALYQQSETVSHTTPDRSKRRKTVGPVGEVVEKVEAVSSAGSLFYLQVVVFFIDRHWSTLHDEPKRQLFTSIHSLLIRLDTSHPMLQNWAFIAVGRLADLQAEADDETWQSLWTISLRRLSQAATCRAASHTAERILASQIVPISRLGGDIRTMLEHDLLVLGPTFPFDSTCSFLVRSLQLASKDAQLFRLDLGGKVTSWLTAHLAPSNRTQLDVAQLLSLCGSACSTTIAPFASLSIKPSCAVARAELQRVEFRELRAFTFDATLPPYEVDGSGKGPEAGGKSGAAEVGGAKEAVALLSGLSRALRDAGPETNEEDVSAHWLSLPLYRARHFLDIAVLVLLLCGLLDRAGTRPPLAYTCLKQACDVISSLSVQLVAPERAVRDRWTLLSAFDPLLAPPSFLSRAHASVVVDPGPSSGVPVAKQRTKRTTDERTEATKERLDILHRIWSREDVCNAFEPVRKMLRAFLNNEAAANGFEDDGTGDPGFAERVAPLTGGNNVLDSDEGVIAAMVPHAVRALVSMELCRSDPPAPARVPDLVATLEQCDAQRALPIAQTLFEAVRAGHANLTLEEADAILQRLGGDFLPSYELARNVDFQLLGLDALEAMLPLWITDQVRSGFGANARQLCSWYAQLYGKKRIAAWRIRHRFANWLDAFLALNPDQSAWDATETPSELLPSMLGDNDLRVRFYACASVGRLFPLALRHGRGDNVQDAERALFRMVGAHLSRNMDQAERIMTTVLILINVIVASARQRIDPYAHLLSIASRHADYLAHIVSAFDAIAIRLGLGDRAALYRFMAPCITEKQSKMSEANRNGPVAEVISGYASRRQAAEATFVPVGAIWLASNDQAAFAAHCKLTGRQIGAGTTLCFHAAAAKIVCEVFARDGEATAPEPRASERLQKLAASTDLPTRGNWKKALASAMDTVVGELLASMWEPNPRDDGSYMEAIVGGRSPAENQAAIHFHHLMAHAGLQDLPRLMSNSFHPLVIKRALVWLDSIHPVFSHPATVYRVCETLLSRSGAAPFVPEQLVALVNFSFFLSMCGPQLRNPHIVRLTLHSLVVLFEREEASHVAYGATIYLVNEVFRDPNRKHIETFGLQLLRCARITMERMERAASAELEAFHRGRLDHLEALLRGTFDAGATDPLHQEGLHAAALWPRDLVDIPEIAFDTLVKLLDSDQLDSGKFALVIPLLRSKYDVQALPAVLWRLLASLEPNVDVPVEQAVAFSQLLLAAGGEVTPVWQTTGVSTSVRTIAYESDIQDRIVTRIAAMLASHDLHRVALAARALLRACSASSEKAFAAVAEGSSRCGGEVALYADQQLLRPYEAIVVKGAKDLGQLTSPAWKKETRTYEKWACGFAVILAEVQSETHPFYAQLYPLLHDDPSFAGAILPMIVHSLLSEDLERSKSPLAGQLMSYFRSLLTSNSTPLPCVRSIIAIASHLREFKRNGVDHPASQDFWLPDLQWTVLSEGAARCSMYTTSLLFIELAAEYEGLQVGSEGGQSAAESAKARELLYSIYEHVDEPDGFYGIPVVDSAKSLLRRYKHEGQALDIFSVQGAAYEGSNGEEAATTLSVVEAISQFGLNRLAMDLLQPNRTTTTSRDAVQAPDFPFHLAWRSESWSLPVTDSPLRGSSASVYAALRSIHRERDEVQRDAAIGQALKIEMHKLRPVDLTSPVADRKVLEAMLGIRETHAWQRQHFDQAGNLHFEQLGEQMSLGNAQSTLLTRLSLIRSIKQADSAADEIVARAALAEKATLLELSKRARIDHQAQSALTAITAALRLDLPNDGGERATEYARVLWSRGEHALAIEAMKVILRGVRAQAVSDQRSDLECQLLSDLGEWSANARLLSSSDIATTFFEPAEVIANKAPKRHAGVFLAFAAFQDGQYKTLMLRKEEMRTLQEYQDRKAGELERLPTTRPSSARQSSSSGSERTTDQLRKEAQGVMRLDRERLARFGFDTAAALTSATRLYAQVLACSDAHDDIVYRLSALWLEHHADEAFNAAFASQLASIPSRKFVPLAHQLSARMSKLSGSSNAFSTSLDHLVGRLTREHPFHVLYHIYALRATVGAATQPASSTMAPKTRKSLGMESIRSSQAGRHKLATDYFAHAKGDARLLPRIKELEQACDAYTEAASLPRVEASSRKAAIELPNTAKLLKLRQLSIPISTYDLPLDPTMLYNAEELPCIARYDKTYSVLGGINAPKLVACHSTKGKRMRQLLKGGDDTRQDAVMEQVFGVVNHLLARDPATRRRDLHVRRYKVIPLVGNNGLIEFINDARPIGELIVPLHTLYNPKDISIAKLRQSLKDNAAAGTVEKTENFTKLMKRFHPAMRHLFRDRRKLATPWFEMRLNFQRSVAAVSMVGWILGIGDRHVSNLMLDENSGEMVPIDFGIAFDAAELLPVPEKVPFRMTQDIVDGLGLTGVDGVFRRCSEELLRVLREQADTIMSILEVLKYDPLQKWTLTSGKASKAQEPPPRSPLDPAPSIFDDEDVPADATRALAGVWAKLSATLSVQQRVTELIRQATAMENLATIFYGWQPYL